MTGPSVLVLSHNLWHHGTWFRAVEVARALARMGWRVTFAGTGEQYYRARRGRWDSIRVWKLPNWSPTHLFERVIPKLRAAGVPDDAITTMTDENPARWFEGSEKP